MKKFGLTAMVLCCVLQGVAVAQTQSQIGDRDEALGLDLEVSDAVSEYLGAFGDAVSAGLDALAEKDDAIDRGATAQDLLLGDAEYDLGDDLLASAQGQAGTRPDPDTGTGYWHEDEGDDYLDDADTQWNKGNYALAASKYRQASAHYEDALDKFNGVGMVQGAIEIAEGAVDQYDLAAMEYMTQPEE